LRVPHRLRGSRRQHRGQDHPRDFLKKIEKQYGKAERIWIMDRGIPTEEALEEMRGNDPPVSYLVGTPKGRLAAMENTVDGKRFSA
jgi:hypothetical protein